MAAIESLLAVFPRERTWLLPALQAVQADRGWLSADDLAAVGAHLRVPASEVYGVATHYPELRLAPRGRHLVRVCTGVSCRVNGGLGLLQALRGRLGAEPEVTLEEADCCFVCSVAPVVEVDHGYLGGPTVEEVVAACRSEAPHPTLSPRRGEGGRGEVRVLVATGSCGLARGAGATLAALRAALPGVDVREGACPGPCHAAPVVDVWRPGAARLTLGRVTAERVPAVARLLAGAGDHGLDAVDFAGQQRVLSARWNAIDPVDLEDARRAGSYATLAAVLERGDPAAVIAAVKASGLQGRGGAYFPAAVKWEGCRAARGEPKYLVVNGEEGEPGIFKDRHLMEADPHLLLEGMLLAAYAAGASRGILYVHGEANRAAERCAAALAEARAAGLVGPRVLGRDFAFEVELRRGAGGFILGEETALLESIEGRRAMPRPKPPFPVEAGVFGKPTVINNVETLAAVPLIVGGRPEAAATKLYGLSGHVARPGVVEVAPPVTLRRLVDELGGGVRGGRALQAVVIGGPSGVIVPPAFLDTPLERPRLSPGTGGIVALDESVSVLDVVRTLMAFNARESCGKCTPCREGTARLLAALDRRDPDAQRVLRELGEVVQLGSLCGLGQAAPLGLRAALEHFPATFTPTGG
jgi:NADH:ubiquinone oxidoreductase subunit F (NADH-binding)/NADH:ubiquinone oxidoreductase subunit E